MWAKRLTSCAVENERLPKGAIAPYCVRPAVHRCTRHHRESRLVAAGSTIRALLGAGCSAGRYANDQFHPATLLHHRSGRRADLCSHFLGSGPEGRRVATLLRALPKWNPTTDKHNLSPAQINRQRIDLVDCAVLVHCPGLGGGGMPALAGRGLLSFAKQPFAFSIFVEPATSPLAADPYSAIRVAQSRSVVSRRDDSRREHAGTGQDSRPATGTSVGRYLTGETGLSRQSREDGMPCSSALKNSCFSF
jgi:hypothetical protein